jgi:hypothetical protein
MVGGTTPVGGSAQATPGSFDPEAYFVASLFRSDHPAPEKSFVPLHAEVGGILMNALRQKEIPVADGVYLTKLIMAATGIQQADAEKRVTDVFSSAREAAESARKMAARALLWLFIALLTGAFCSSYAATIGGRQRDAVETVSEVLGK